MDESEPCVRTKKMSLERQQDTVSWLVALKELNMVLSNSKTYLSRRKPLCIDTKCCRTFDTLLEASPISSLIFSSVKSAFVFW